MTMYIYYVLYGERKVQTTDETQIVNTTPSTPVTARQIYDVFSDLTPIFRIFRMWWFQFFETVLGVYNYFLILPVSD